MATTAFFELSTFSTVIAASSALNALECRSAKMTLFFPFVWLRNFYRIKSSNGFVLEKLPLSFSEHRRLATHLLSFILVASLKGRLFCFSSHLNSAKLDLPCVLKEWPGRTVGGLARYVIIVVQAVSDSSLLQLPKSLFFQFNWTWKHFTLLLDPIFFNSRWFVPRFM